MIDEKVLFTKAVYFFWEMKFVKKLFSRKSSKQSIPSKESILPNLDDTIVAQQIDYDIEARVATWKNDKFAI